MNGERAFHFRNFACSASRQSRKEGKDASLHRQADRHPDRQTGVEWITCKDAIYDMNDGMWYIRATIPSL